MQFFMMIWNGIGGMGVGTVILKALFIILLGAIFWMLCELVKYLINVVSRLAVDTLRYLAVVARGWPEDSEDPGREAKGVSRKSTDRPAH